MQHPLFILAVLFAIIIFCEWLNQHTFLRKVGTTLMVILVAAVTANIGIIPSASDAPPLYGGIFTYLAPLSIFYLLLGVNLKDLKEAGLPMIMMFGIGGFGTALGALIATFLFGEAKLLQEYLAPFAGMMTGTYIGGSANFNAVALHYDMMEEGAFFAGTVAVDNILTAIWMISSLAIPAVLQRYFPRKELKMYTEESGKTELDTDNEREWVDPYQFALLGFLGILTLWFSNLSAAWLKEIGVTFPSILILTTIALILAQFPQIQKIQGAKLLGLLCVYLFLAVIGAFCEFAALSQIGELAMLILGFTTTVVLVHGLVIFGLGGLLKQDWSLIAVASQANIGGASTAMALAKSLKRPGLMLPAIMVGSLGAGVGTYIGFLVAGLLGA
ncbi:MAG: DUF819 family protein [Bacteroidota bacterium]